MGRVECGGFEGQNPYNLDGRPPQMHRFIVHIFRSFPLRKATKNDGGSRDHPLWHPPTPHGVSFLGASFIKGGTSIPPPLGCARKTGLLSAGSMEQNPMVFSPWEYVKRAHLSIPFLYIVVHNTNSPIFAKMMAKCLVDIFSECNNKSIGIFADVAYNNTVAIRCF